MEDKRYPIELEVITPLSVGAGNDNEWVKGLDFVQKEGKVYVIDMQKVAAAGVDVEALTALFLKSDDFGISQLLGSKIGELSRYIFSLPAKTDNNIKTFLRTQMFDKPLVAGSSIKGSVRSALFNYLRTTEEKNEEVFGTMKDGTDFMRFIRIGDVEMPSTVLVNTKIFNLRGHGSDWQGGWKHRGTDREGNSHTDNHYNPVGFNTLYECVAPGKKGIGNISLAANAFSLLEKYGPGKSLYAGQKRTLLNEPINCLFKIINNVTKAYLQKERAFFQKYDAERTDEVLSCIESLLSMIPSDGSSCLMKMSAGVGFHSITGDWQYDDYDKTKLWTDGRHAGKKKYKSRKIAEYNHRLQLMGFVKMRTMNEQEVIRAETSRKIEHQATIDSVLCSVRKQEEARRAAAELAARKQQEREEEKRRKESFQTLMEQARHLYAEDHWDEAIAQAKEALSLCSAEQAPAQLIESCENAKRLKAFAEQEAAATAERFNQPLAEVLKGIVSIGNMLGTTTKWLKVDGHTLGESEYEALLEGVKALPAREQRNLQKKRKDFVKVMGEEKAQWLLNSFQ